MHEKIDFALKMLRKRLQGQSTACPYCTSERTTRLQRKQILLELRECQECKLRFRYPKDDVVDNFDYYQESYQQHTVTDLPSEAELEGHIRENFRRVGRDISEHLEVICQFATGGRLLDFGASWGYCTWQFKQAGYDAVGYEISRPRTEYGKKMLGVTMINNTRDLPDHSIDVIYSAHVLEHMPDPGATLREFRRLLAPKGFLFVFVPNGAGEPARRLGVNWTPLINQRHVMAYTPQFFANALPREGFTAKFASTPYGQPLRQYDPSTPPFNGEELLAIGSQ